MRVSAKADYAIRAVAELAATDPEVPLKAETISTSQDIPVKFLLNILFELRRAGILRSQRGADGGYQLARPASEVSLADVIRAVEGPLAQVGDSRPEELKYNGVAESLVDVWVAVRANLRAILDVVTIADVARHSLPRTVRNLARDPDAWVSH